MRFEYKLNSNNITYKDGDTLLINFEENFKNIRSIESIGFDFDPLETDQNGHEIFIRWTYDVNQIDRAIGKPHVVWSAWEMIFDRGKEVLNYRHVLNKIIREKNPNPRLNQDSFDVQFKIIRRGPLGGARMINLLTIDLKIGNTQSSIEDPPIRIDGCKANACPTTNFSSGIVIQCDKNLFRPYDVINPAIKIYHEMSSAISEMFGHCVRYFKTQAKIESADPILKEYSLFEVTDVKDIKILIPDNQFPDNAIKFLPYDMDFGEGIECHIVKEHFERAFGQNDLPEQKDYIYFPLIDRIFEVQSAYLFRDFMATEAYYKVMLYKWQDKLNVMRENPEIDKYVNDLHESLDEILEPEIKREYLEITKPLQYRTISVGGFDHIRSHTHENLKIENRDLTNYFTIVGKYFYALNQNINKNDIAVRYKLEVNRKLEDNTAITMWFKPLGSTNSDILIDGFNPNQNKGIGITLDYNLDKSTKSISVLSNAQRLVFSKNFPRLSSSDWYGLVVNHMNDYKQVSIHLWKMKYDSTKSPQNQSKTTDLQLIYTEVLDLVPEEINPSNTTWMLRGSNLNITNIRIWKESIEEEVQPLILNQYVVKDQDLALLIDNAIPSLKLPREFVR